jgi:hypothetical protein
LAICQKISETRALEPRRCFNTIIGFWQNEPNFVEILNLGHLWEPFKAPLGASERQIAANWQNAKHRPAFCLGRGRVNKKHRLM